MLGTMHIETNMLNDGNFPATKARFIILYITYNICTYLI